MYLNVSSFCDGNEGDGDSDSCMEGWNFVLECVVIDVMFCVVYVVLIYVELKENKFVEVYFCIWIYILVLLIISFFEL